MLDPSAIPNHQARRMRSCGKPLRLHRESGAITDTVMGCGVRWCPTCGWRYRLRVQSRIGLATGALVELEDGDLVRSTGRRVWLLTLTQPKPVGGLSQYALERAMELHRQLWREAKRRVDWWAHRARRGDVSCDEQLQPPRLDDGLPHPTFATTYDENTGGWPDPDDDGYVWAIETTDGGGDSTWNVHRHVICTSLAVAERFNAGWQHAVRPLGIMGSRWASTDITEVSAHAAAWYVAGYVTAHDEVGAIPVTAHRAYARAMHGAQRYNAGGACRPLGIARAPSDDAVVAVELLGSLLFPDPIPAAEFYAGDHGIWHGAEPRDEDWRVVPEWRELVRGMLLLSSTTTPRTSRARGRELADVVRRHEPESAEARAP